ncbi:mycofactocin biosynthesis peptidyl-dipeptidase MftE [Phycicoccus sp. Soil802]|uniref:mycofactocin biosynthesis peptidyl-dipeptidase MftE n=1 Tax=Phycicoccus sp. Soil802 TaxID=1736414 RepID=UPI0007029849|nr:mycofactocin biosynthesis peptidyl-dipeptidase MftE [Phycicoccus sp. Soil802]KRF22418.1 mycofactocin system creatininase [Phycicoccus sp. Soil802]
MTSGPQAPTAFGLAEAVWPEVPNGATVLVPVGALEQHGPHLPLDTDSVIARAVSEAAAALLGPDVYVAPVLAYGSSGEHQAFPGTVSIGGDALTLLLVEVTRSLLTWSDRVVFVNGHGGNIAALSAAVIQLRREGHEVGWSPCATEHVDAHAGFTETSLMLHLRPRSVRLRRAQAGNTTPIAQLLPALVEHGVRPLSPNGVLGDPTGATAREGLRLLKNMALDVALATRAGLVNHRGMFLVPEVIPT